jgi:hypothetical protein
MTDRFGAPVVADSSAAASLATTSEVDRSGECIDYLIARTEMTLRNAVEKSRLLRQVVFNASSESLDDQRPTGIGFIYPGATLATISEADRSSECIDYLIARTELTLHNAVEKSRRLRQVVFNASSESVNDPVGTSASFYGSAMMAPPSQYYGYNFASMSDVYPPMAVSAPSHDLFTHQSVSLTSTVKSSSGSAADTKSSLQARKGHVDLNSLWRKRYGQLIRFKEINGHCNVPQRYATNVELGRWVKDQRTFKTKGKLYQERIDLLNDIGFSWKLTCHSNGKGKTRGCPGLDHRTQQL